MLVDPTTRHRDACINVWHRAHRKCATSMSGSGHGLLTPINARPACGCLRTALLRWRALRPGAFGWNRFL